MSTQANPVTNAAPPAGGGSADFDSFAESTLGIESGMGHEVDAAPVEKVPATETAAAAVVDGKVAGTEGAKPGEVVAPQDELAFDANSIAVLLTDPTHGPIVKALYEKFTKASELAKVWGPEGNEARALVPGGLGELKETVEMAKSARAEAADFASGDPTRQRTALGSIAEQHPEQFVAGMPLYMELAAQKNPQAYAAHMKGELTRALQGDGVVETLGALFTAAKANNGDGDEKAFGEAFGKLSQWFEKAGFAPAGAPAKTGDGKKVDPELAAAQAKIAEYEQRDADAKKAEFQSTFKTWWEPTGTAVSTGIREAAKERLESFLPTNIEKNFREFTMNQLLDKVEHELGQQLLTDLGHQEKLSAVLKGDAWKSNGDGARTQYVNLQVGRAKQLLARTVEKVMEKSGQTARAVDTAAGKTAKEKAAAATADVTGSGGGTRPKSLSVKDVRAGGALANKTDEEILEM